MKVRDFKEYELQLIIDFFMYYIDLDMRGKLMTIPLHLQQVGRPGSNGLRESN